MQAIFRSPHILKGRFMLKRCQQCHLSIQCICRTNLQILTPNFNYSNRLLSLSSPCERLFNQKNDYRSRIVFSSYQHQFIPIRNFTLSTIRYEKEPLKPSSKVEVAVQELKKKKEELPAEAPAKQIAKKSLQERIKDEIIHYYHGFRLLFIDIKISFGLAMRVLNGKNLTRREYRLLTRTVGDLFRLVPFSVFIIVPFMEFLLPFFIKFFPGMLPSTFQTATEREDKLKQSLQVKLEMAKFLQQTLDEMSLQHKDHNSQQAKEFSEWVKKIRTSGEQVNNEEILKYAKLFQDELTLDSLSRSQLVALCRVLEVQTLGTNNLLRFQLRMKLRSLAADDKMIQREGVDSLTLQEVQLACKARGMRAYGVSEARLRTQLSQWLDLSLNEKVPPSLLLMSRALMLPETIPTGDKLKATISVLPEAIITQTKASIGEKEGKIDNKVLLEIIKEEERKITEEREERREEKLKSEEEDLKKKEMQQIKLQEDIAKKEELIDTAPIISQEATPELVDTAKVQEDEKLKEVQVNPKDVKAIEAALNTITKEKKSLMVEKETIEDLKAELKDYKEDVHDLEKTVADLPEKNIKESKAARRLYKKVHKIVDKMDTVISELDKQKAENYEVSSKKQKQLLKIDEIIETIKENVIDKSRLSDIKKLLLKIDDDCDGALKVEDVLKLIDVIGKENVKLSGKQIDELIDLLDKEEVLEVESKIEKALQEEKQHDVKHEKKKQAEEKKTSSTNPPKPKIETQSTTVPPPIANIDQAKKQDNSSKML